MDPAIEALIAQLQEQINDLTVFLEEERLNHRDTIRRVSVIVFCLFHITSKQLDLFQLFTGFLFFHSEVIQNEKNAIIFL